MIARESFPARRAAHRRRRFAPGYLLTEALVGGAIAAVALLGVVSTMSSAQTKSIVSAREVMAKMLVRDALDAASALSYDGVQASAAAQVVGLEVPYTREVTVTAGAATFLPGRTTAYKDVTATVTFHPAGGTRTVSGTVRIYAK